MWYWFFGLPGSGKSHVAGILSRLTGIPQYEGDNFQTAEDRGFIARGAFTVQRRHDQLMRIVSKLGDSNRKDALITHPLPDKVSRALVRTLHPHGTQLVYVTAPLTLIRKRLRERENHHFGPELLDAWISRHWEDPVNEDTFVIDNGEGVDTLVSQLNQLCGRLHG